MEQAGIRPADNPGYLVKVNILFLGVCALFALLVGRLFFIQVIHGSKFKSMAINNKEQIIRIPAHRGEIFVRGDKVIAKNNPSFSLFVVPNNFPSYTRERKRWRAQVDRISADFGVSTNAILNALKKGRWNPYRPYLLASGVDFDKVVMLAEHLENYPGLHYQQIPVREYIDGEAYAHIVGFIRQINANELRRLYHKGYFPESLIGAKGIEKQYDLELRGKDGHLIQIVDARNRVKSEEKPPDGDALPGNNLVLTIDDRIQKIVHRMMDKYPGGCIVTRPATGEVLALYSYPSFDPNMMIGTVDHDAFEAVRENPDNPFLNRVIQGLYPPSSIFKVAVSCAALRERKISFYQTYYHCQGGIELGTQRFKCEGWHMRQNMNQALINSCNTYFYHLGIDVGYQNVIRYARDYFHLGTPTGIDLPYEKAGQVPTSLWKLEHRGKAWWDGDTANLSIGQGFTATTVVQLNSLISAIANGGVSYRPTLLKKVVSAKTGDLVFEQRPRLHIDLPLDSKSLVRVQSALRQVAVWGTAGHGARSSLEIVGKTGTAQNVQGSAHAWFTCYAPYKPQKPEDTIAITVFIEHGGSGGASAAPFATAILESIFYGTPVTRNYQRIMQPWELKEIYYQEWLKRTGHKPLSEEFLKRLLKS